MKKGILLYYWPEVPLSELSDCPALFPVPLFDSCNKLTNLQKYTLPVTGQKLFRDYFNFFKISK